MTDERAINPTRGEFVRGSRRGVRNAQQSRSQETYERIIDAAIELCDGGHFDRIGVSDICDLAGVSPSSFYARFDDRDALFQVLHEHYLEEMYVGIIEGMSADDWEAMTLTQVVVRFGQLMVQYGRQMGPFLTTMRRTEVDDRTLMDRRITLERSSFSLMIDVVSQRFGDLDAETTTRVRVAFASLLAVLRTMLTPLSAAELLEMDEDRLLLALAEQFVTYTGLPDRPVTTG